MNRNTTVPALHSDDGITLRSDNGIALGSNDGFALGSDNFDGFALGSDNFDGFLVQRTPSVAPPTIKTMSQKIHPTILKFSCLPSSRSPQFHCHYPRCYLLDCWSCSSMVVMMQNIVDTISRSVMSFPFKKYHKLIITLLFLSQFEITRSQK